MIHRIQMFVLAFCLLLAQQGTVLHAMSCLGVQIGDIVSVNTFAHSHHSDKDDGDSLCLQCLAYSALVAAIYVVWPRIAAVKQHFLTFITRFSTIPQRAPQVYAARAPPACAI